MEINIKGNPGTGNTFQEINIGTVQNYNPNATTVINNNYGDKPKSTSAPDKTMQQAEREQRKAEIMEYAMRIKRYVANDWCNRYESIWRNILSLPEVEAVVYEPGKQKDTTFNRNLIANIIYIMCEGGVFATDNATTLAECLEGDKDHSVRAKLRQNPDDKTLERHVKAFLQ